MNYLPMLDPEAQLKIPSVDEQLKILDEAIKATEEYLDKLLMSVPPMRSPQEIILDKIKKQAEKDRREEQAKKDSQEVRASLLKLIDIIEEIKSQPTVKKPNIIADPINPLPSSAKLVEKKIRKEGAVKEDKEEVEKAGEQEEGIMRVSEAGLKFIARHEGLVLVAGPDDVGYLTAGYGHKIEQGEVWDKKKKLDPKEAWSLLEQDAEERAGKYVRHYVEPKLLQHQFDALASFTFNVACRRLRDSILLKDVNGQEYNKEEAGEKKIRKDFMQYVTAKGRYLKGLKLRRGEKLTYFSMESMTGNYYVHHPYEIF
jgi:lysozyme